jgi:phosphomevalonate kinase
VIATAPGKIMLTGEYAVLDGGAAVVIAVDRRVRATVGPAPVALSEFLAAAAEELGREVGAEAAAALARVTVDSEALRQDGHKLGLGSSAAATVAAVAAALHAVGAFDRAHVGRLAAAAHAAAQGRRGAAGSGAAIAASTWGGAIVFTRGAVAPIALPAGLALDAAWTGAPADTATLVAAVTAARAPRRRAALAIAATATGGAPATARPGSPRPPGLRLAAPPASRWSPPRCARAADSWKAGARQDHRRRRGVWS